MPLEGVKGGMVIENKLTVGQVRRSPGTRVDPYLLPLEVIVLGLAELTGHCWVTRLLEGAAGCEGRAWLMQARAGLLARRAPGTSFQVPLHCALLPRPTKPCSLSSGPPPMAPSSKTLPPLPYLPTMALFSLSPPNIRLLTLPTPAVTSRTLHPSTTHQRPSSTKTSYHYYITKASQRLVRLGL